MRRIGLALVLSLASGGAFADQASATDKSNLSATDRDFAHQAAVGGMAEVKLAKLALDRGQSTEVKQFARRMLADHSKANTELKQIADKKNLEIPTQLDDEHQKLYDKLSRLDGAEFDKQYMQVMVASHDETVRAFKQQAQAGQDPDLKHFAMKTLPVIERHEDVAKVDQRDIDKALRMKK
jgi:putative membrane protein